MNLRACPFCGGDAVLTSNYNRAYHKYYVNVRCSVCGSCGKGYTTDQNPEENEWDTSACRDAAAIWNKRPYLNDDIIDLAVELGEYILSKSHTDEVLKTNTGERRESDGKKRKDG